SLDSNQPSWQPWVIRPVTQVLPHPGDFNHDNVVDAGDYVFLRKNNGSVDDFALYRANFGWSASGGSGSALAAVATRDSAKTTNVATSQRAVTSATSAQTKE